MPAPARNIEAYNVINDILVVLREATQRALTAFFGERWHESIPRELFDRLVARKERESAVIAYNDSYFTLLEFADFSDLLVVYQQHPDVARFLTNVSPNPQVRQTRLIELQAIHDKMAGAREINEAELAFLKNALTRVASGVGDLGDITHDRTIWPGRTQPAPRPAAPAPPPPATGSPVPPPRPTAGSSVAAPPPVAAPPAAEAPASWFEVQPAVPSPPPPPAPQASPAVADAAPRQASAALAAAAAERQATAAASGGEGQAGSAPDIAAALAAGDETAIIEALYHEVLGLSESLVAAGGPRRPRVWEQVAESQWYQRRFATLGLKTVSDYYDLYLSACDRLRAGASKAQLQEFLQAHSFAKVVLNIGVFFHQRRGRR